MKGKTNRRSENARRVIQQWNAQMRDKAPLCGARRKYDGGECRQIAMANGRCYYHGGRTPKGNKWHRPLWPKKGPADDRKLVRKLRQLENARRERQRRIAAMTDAERQQYERWLRLHPPGSAAARRNAAARRKADQQARALISTAPGPSVKRAIEASQEIERIERMIEELERQRASALEETVDIFS